MRKLVKGLVWAVVVCSSILVVMFMIGWSQLPDVDRVKPDVVEATKQTPLEDKYGRGTKDPEGKLKKRLESGGLQLCEHITIDSEGKSVSAWIDCKVATEEKLLVFEEWAKDKAREPKGY